jgi:hypothetical protein
VWTESWYFQLGFRPAAKKKALLSLWSGTAGGVSYDDISSNFSFTIVDHVTGQTKFSGPVQLRKRASESDDAYGANLQKSDVYEMNFDSLTEAGYTSVDIILQTLFCCWSLDEFCIRGLSCGSERNWL